MEKKLRAMLIFPAVLIVIFSLNFDRYSELLYIAYILMSLNLIMLGIQAFRENKKSLFAYGITAISLLTIFLALQLLLK
jgi:general stress protein CsbA